MILIIRLVIIFLLLLSMRSFSQNIYGGELVLENIGSLSYKSTVAVSIDNSVNTNNNPYFLLDWGDNTSLDTVKPISVTCGTVAYTKSYTSTHTYSSIGNYTLSCYIGNFSSSIVNMPIPNNKSLTLEYQLLSPGINSNSSPVASSCLTNTFAISQNTFNQNSNDVNLDSLSYQIYNPPFAPGFTSSGFTINSLSGLITKSNSNTGHYLVPVIIEEWRKISGTNYLVGISIRYHSLIYNSTIGVNELTTLNSINIYPNPATSVINIIDEQNELQNSTIEIKNYLGDVVYSSSFSSQINLSYLSSGMYFLTIHTDHNSKTIKLVKQ